METLFIIGNGFDLNLGLKTKYIDFYNYYNTTESRTDRIRDLKSEISKDISNWADLELALGLYTKNISTTREFDEIFEDITEKLSDYLKLEVNKLDFSKINTKKLLEDLSNPIKYMPKSDLNSLDLFMGIWFKDTWYTNIVSLNYTETIEKLVDINHGLKRIGEHHSKESIYLQRIEHIHGYLDDRMILGVNDISQIENQDLHNNKDIVDVLVKPLCNKASKETTDDFFIQSIEAANLICIFGSSISDTDKIWWELIGNRLKKNDCRLIIFRKPEQTSQRLRYMNIRIEREAKTLFLSKTSLTDEEKANVSDRIFVCANSAFFSDLLDTPQ